MHINNTSRTTVFCLIICLMAFELACQISLGGSGGDKGEAIIVDQLPKAAQNNEETYSVKIWAAATNLEKGECTDIFWETSGGKAYIDGMGVASTGEFNACFDESYTIKLEVENNVRLLGTKTLTIYVNEDVKAPASSDSNNSSSSSSSSNSTSKTSAVTFDFNPKSGPSGTEVVLTLNQTADGAAVYYDDKVVPVKKSNWGKMLTITIPANSKSAYLALVGNGINVRSKNQFAVTDGIKQAEIKFPTADLALTDLYPTNMPNGKLGLRVTHRGGDPLVDFSAEFMCKEVKHRKDGAEYIDFTKADVIYFTLYPGETRAFESWVDLNTDLYSFDFECHFKTRAINQLGVAEFIDPVSSNNTYKETIP